MNSVKGFSLDDVKEVNPLFEKAYKKFNIQEKKDNEAKQLPVTAHASAPRNKKLIIKTNIPLERATSSSVGYDLKTPSAFTLKPKHTHIVDTNIKIVSSNSKNWHIRVCPKSGLGFKFGILPFEGVIDSDFTGTIKVLLTNHGKNSYEFAAGDKIAQIIIYQNNYFANEKIVHDDNFVHSGFGSTGN